MGSDYLQTLLHSWTQPFLWLLDNKQPENHFYLVYYSDTLQFFILTLRMPNHRSQVVYLPCGPTNRQHDPSYSLLKTSPLQSVHYLGPVLVQDCVPLLQQNRDRKIKLLKNAFLILYSDLRKIRNFKVLYPQTY